MAPYHKFSKKAWSARTSPNNYHRCWIKTNMWKGKKDRHRLSALRRLKLCHCDFLIKAHNVSTKGWSSSRVCLYHKLKKKKHFSLHGWDVSVRTVYDDDTAEYPWKDPSLSSPPSGAHRAILIQSSLPPILIVRLWFWVKPLA